MIEGFSERKDTKQSMKWAELWDLCKSSKQEIYLPQYCKNQYQNSCLRDQAFTSTISAWTAVKFLVSKSWIRKLLTAANPWYRMRLWVSCTWGLTISCRVTSSSWTAAMAPWLLLDKSKHPVCFVFQNFWKLFLDPLHDTFCHICQKENKTWTFHPLHNE